MPFFFLLTQGSWHTDAALWIAMEYCGGGSVSDLMHASGQPLSEPLVSYVCSEALRGLVYLHGMGKLHRDIKYGVWDVCCLLCVGGHT